MAQRPMEAAGAVDAQNAPTAPWKTRRRVSTATTGTFTENRGLECYPCSRFTLLPMFPAAHGHSDTHEFLGILDDPRAPSEYASRQLDGHECITSLGIHRH
jgi:hypothetical protein